MHTFHSITTLYVFVREWNDAAVVPVRQVSFYSRKNDTELLFVRTLVVLIAVRCIFVMKLLNLKLLNYLFCNNGCNFVNVGTMPEQCKVSYIGSTSFRCLQNSSHGFTKKKSITFKLFFQKEATPKSIQWGFSKRVKTCYKDVFF